MTWDTGRPRDHGPIGQLNANVVQVTSLFTDALGIEIKHHAAEGRKPPPAFQRLPNELPSLARRSGSVPYHDDDDRADYPRRRSRTTIDSDDTVATKPLALSTGGLTARTNHLGMPAARGGRVSVKYSRGYTIVRNRTEPSQKMRDSERTTWLLSDELAKQVDVTTDGLHQLLDRFASATGGVPSAFVGAHIFWRVLQSHGVYDPVLAQRLFTEVAEGTKLDYRALLYALLVRCLDPPHHKLALLFRLYDIDGSGTFSQSEMLQILTKDRPPEQQRQIVERTRHVWTTLLKLATDRTGLTFGESDELGLNDLLAACEVSDEVCDFFEGVLAKSRPADAYATPSKRHHHGAKLQAMTDPAASGRSSEQPSPSRSQTKRHVTLGLSASAPTLPTLDRRSSPALPNIRPTGQTFGSKAPTGLKAKDPRRMSRSIL